MISLKKTAISFLRSPGQARNPQFSWLQLIGSRLNRVGVGYLYAITSGPNTNMIYPRGPLSPSSGNHVDPLFLNYEVVTTHEDGSTATTVATYDPIYADMTVVATANFTPPSYEGQLGTFTNVQAVEPFFSQQFLPSGFSVPIGALRPANPPNFFYQTGFTPSSTVNSISNSTATCSASVSTPGYWAGGKYTYGVEMTITLTIPRTYSQYAADCLEILRSGATLLDSITDPTKFYNYDGTRPDSGTAADLYLRFRRDWAAFGAYGGALSGLPKDGIAVAVDRTGYYFFPMPVWSNWTKTTNGLTAARCGLIAAYGMPSPSDSSGYAISGTPTPINNAASIWCVSSAAELSSKLSNQKAWIFNPSSDSFSNETWSPASSSAAGRRVFDVLTIDPPTGYITPPDNSFGLDTISPLAADYFGYLYGDLT